MSEYSDAGMYQPSSLDLLLEEIWHDVVVPLMREKATGARATRAGLFGVLGGVAGAAADGIYTSFTGKESNIGKVVGGMVGGVGGWFAPEIADWGYADRVLHEDDWASVEAETRQRTVRMELHEKLDLFQITPTATHDEFQRAYRRLALRWHPDANPGDAAAKTRMVAINTARDEIQKAYDSGELPMAA